MTFNYIYIKKKEVFSLMFNNIYIYIKTIRIPILISIDILNSLASDPVRIGHFAPNTSFHQFGAYHRTFGFANSFLLLFGQMSLEFWAFKINKKQIKDFLLYQRWLMGRWLVGL